MKQFKCSMSKKIERLGKKQEAISGKNLMDPEQFEKDIREMIAGEYEKILKGCDDEERRYYEMALEIWDDCGYDYAGELYEKLQQQMYEYVSGTDYRMPGNFANIAWDWEDDHKDGIKFADLRKKLLDGVKDADTDEFSTWAIDWFFHAFGTYNMCYNFANDLGEEVAILEQEDEEERERENSDESKKRSCSMSKKKESLAKKSEGLSEYRHYTNPDNGRTASLDPIKHPGLNKFIVYFEAGEKRYSSIKDAEDDLKSRGYEKDESKKSEDASSVDDLLARHNQKWLVKVSYDVDASHSAVAPSIVRADTKDAATNIALKRHRGLGYNMKVVSVEPMTESRKKSESKKNERGTTKIETYEGFDELLGYADAEYVLEDVVDVLSKYYTYEGEGDDIVFDEDQAKDDPEFTIKIEGGDERADFYSEDIFYVHLPNKEAAEELAKVLGGELSESKKPESKKSEGISDMIDAKIDYNMFMRMCKTAAYLEEDEDYWDALWEYYSDLGSIGDALVFFDNLFQYTSWKTAEDLWTDYSNILGDKPEGKDYEEALDAYLDENDNEVGNSAVYKYGDHYLMLH